MVTYFERRYGFSEGFYTFNFEIPVIFAQLTIAYQMP